MAHHPQWGRPAEACLLDDWADRYGQEGLLSQAVEPTLRRLAQASPYAAWAMHMVLCGEQSGYLSEGLEHLFLMPWFSVS